MYIDRGTKPEKSMFIKCFLPSCQMGWMWIPDIFTGVDEYLPLPAPTNVQAEPEDKGVMLSWDGLFQGSVFTAFWEFGV